MRLHSLNRPLSKPHSRALSQAQDPTSLRLSRMTKSMSRANYLEGELCVCVCVCSRASASEKAGHTTHITRSIAKVQTCVCSSRDHYPSRGLHKTRSRPRTATRSSAQVQTCVCSSRDHYPSRGPHTRLALDRVRPHDRALKSKRVCAHRGITTPRVAHTQDSLSTACEFCIFRCIHKCVLAS